MLGAIDDGEFAIIGADCHGVGYCETETESPSSTNRDRVRPALAVKIMFQWQVTVTGTQIVRFLLARS
jgi:hypothetical protein